MSELSFRIALESLSIFADDATDRKTLTLDKAKKIVEKALEEIEKKL